MEIRIGSTKYNLILKKTALDFEGEEVLGLIDENEGIIHLHTDVPVQRVKQIFWHECIHGALNEIGMEALGDDEGFVDALSKQLYAFHEDNKLDKIYEALSK